MGRTEGLLKKQSTTGSGLSLNLRVLLKTNKQVIFTPKTKWQKMRVRMYLGNLTHIPGYKFKIDQGIWPRMDTENMLEG